MFDFELYDHDYSIIQFQYKLFDLVLLDKTKIGDKLNYMTIIKSNLIEFIASRLQRYTGAKLIILYGAIEDLFNAMGDAMFIINRLHKWHSDKIPTYELLSNKIDKFYSGEGDENNNEDDKKEQTFSLLFSHKYEGSENITIKFRVSNEVLLLSEYVKDYKPFYPITNRPVGYVKIGDYYEYLKCHDLLIRNPYDSYQYVLDFIDQMCNHEKIESVMISLYRVAKSSKIIDSLIKAKENGKNVYVYIETSANGNEEINEKYVELLKSKGIVVRSNLGIKAHAKLFLAISKEGHGYAHISTGNYNEETSKVYVDVQYMTADQKITDDVMTTLLLLMKKELSDDSHDITSLAPMELRHNLYDLIDKEILKRNKGRIWIKCNNLCDQGIINRLYLAGQVGVDVKIIVRTGCRMHPTKHIQIRSKVGNYLEHDRLYLFGKRAYIGSADLYNRNISNRLEILCEVLQPRKLYRLFNAIWDDPYIHILKNDGLWELV